MDLPLEKRLRLSSPIIDDDGYASKTADPDGGHREQVPGPSGIRHHMEEINTSGTAPQARQVWNKPEHGANAPNSLDPPRTIRCVNPHKLDFDAGLAEQPGKLLRLIPHPARRWRQRPHQAEGNGLRPLHGFTLAFSHRRRAALPRLRTAAPPVFPRRGAYAAA